MGAKWSLRLRVFLFFALIALGGIAAFSIGLYLAFVGHGSDEALSAFIRAGVIGSFALMGLTAWIWLLFDENVARPLTRLAAELRARAHAGVEQDIDHAPAKYLGDIAPAAAAVAANLTETRSELAEAVARETERIAQDKARLEAILRDIPEGVILCTRDHRIVLYNRQALALLGGGALGLDRPLFDLLREAPIRHALERLGRERNGETDNAVDLLCATADGGGLLQGKMRRLTRFGGDNEGGYVLTLSDVTAELSANAERDKLLREMLERIRRPAANLRTTLEILDAYPDLEGGERAHLQEALTRETGTLSDAIIDLGKRHDATAARWWPMAEVPAGDLADSIRAFAEADGVSLNTESEPLLLRCDGFALAQVLGGIAAALPTHAEARDLQLVIASEGTGATVVLSWEGGVLPVEQLETWLHAPMEGGYSGYTAKAALESHGTELWPEAPVEGRACLRLPLREARPESGAETPAARSEFYDFGLLAADAPGTGDNRPLSALNYVVFDTETTGLLPSEGDEIVQIAAVRIVNGRMLTGEALDMLVDPERPIPASSTAVHHVTEEMVQGAPTIGEAGRQFHAYCRDAVLIAHNAPFDMAFLRRHEERIGERFEHPILDTVLLSAIVFGQEAEHSLDALAERLEVVIPEEARHTALGDSLATAEAFLKMVPMLSERGIGTLGEAIAEFRKHRNLLESLN